MNIHEYQARSLLQRYGVAVPRGGVAYTPHEAESVAKSLGGAVWVVKAQIDAGRRGAGHFKDNPCPFSGHCHAERERLSRVDNGHSPSLPSSPTNCRLLVDDPGRPARSTAAMSPG